MPESTARLGRIAILWRGDEAARRSATADTGGQGVWKVETLASPRNRPMIRVLDATKDASEELALDEFLERCVEYFEDGCVIDQPFQARLSEGVLRWYMAGDRCAGFGHQKVKALVDAPAARAEAGPRLYTFSADPRFQRLCRLMEDEWTPQLTSLLNIPRRDLPDDLGRGLHARHARRRWDRQLRARRYQRQFGVPDPRRGVGGDRPPSCRSAGV
jgi:Domain of unknown function (DUF6815)